MDGRRAQLERQQQELAEQRRAGGGGGRPVRQDSLLVLQARTGCLRLIWVEFGGHCMPCHRLGAAS